MWLPLAAKRCLGNQSWACLRFVSTTYNTKVELPTCSYVPKKYKGKSYEETLQIHKSNLSFNKCHFKNPLLLTEGRMQWLFDNKGKRYLDMFAGIATVSVGHCHPKVVAATAEQMNTLWHTTNVYLHPKIHEYAEKLVAQMPENLKVCYFVNSGSEANDLAVTLARVYTGNYNVVSLRNSYHGSSPTIIGLTTGGKWKPNYANGFGMHHTMNPDVYTGIWGGSNCRDSPIQTNRKCDCQHDNCDATEKYLEQLDELLFHSMPEGKVAGFIVEPIQGVGGIVQYPKTYLKNAFELIRKHGGVCIADEVQTGFGRTGDHFWGFEGHDVVPDIVTVAKGIANGFPMGAVITTPEIAKAYSKTAYINTFGGNPMACAAAGAVLDVIQEEKIQANALEVGNYLLQELVKLRERFGLIGDVRGKGLMIGIEMVTNKKDRHPVPALAFSKIWEECRNMGLLIGIGSCRNNVFRIQPPMCITKDDAKFTVDVLGTVLEQFENDNALIFL